VSQSLWKRRAEELAQRLPRGRLHPTVTAWADRRAARERWAVAVSGGADSLCLLLLMWAHWPRRRTKLCALHFDHRLRGAAARADARFCRTVCRSLGVAFVGGQWAAPPKLPSEAEARMARFRFFERELNRRKIRALWLGHQQDDIAETMLMRLARGSGAAGLAAPRPLQSLPRDRSHLRPLLDIKRTEITAALRASGAPWREDLSNSTGDFFRNRVRRSVVPAWRRAAGRDALAGAALSRELLEEDDTALQQWVAELKPVTPGGALALNRLAGRPRAVVRRALHQWLLVQSLSGNLSRRGFDSLLSAVSLGKPARHSLGAEGFAVIRGKCLLYVKAS
jgi:tRNA(Ile)-lysidine synthase